MSRTFSPYVEYPELPAAEAGYEWPVSKYLTFGAVLLAVSVPVGVVAYLAGAFWVALILPGIAMVALIGVKPEAGVLLLLTLMPLEDALAVIPRSLSTVRIVGAYVVCAFLIHGLVGRRIRLNDPFIKRQAILVAIMLVSVLLSGYPTEAMVGMQSPIAYLAFTVLTISLVRDWRMVESALVFLFIGGVAGAALAIGMLLLGVESALSYQPGRLSAGEISDPNFFALAISSGLMVMPFMLSRFRNVLARALIAGGAILIVAAIIRSYSRSAWTAVALAFPLAFWLGSRSLSGRVVKTLGFILLALMILALAVRAGWIGEGIQERFMTIGEGARAGGRINIWHVCLRSILEHPILGVGNDLFDFVSYDIATRYNIPLPGERGRDPHNSFLNIMVELGLIGMVTFLAVLIYTWRGLRRLPLSPMRGTLLGIFVLTMMGGMAQTNVTKKAFWMPLALAAAAITVFRRQQSELELVEAPPPAEPSP